MTLKAKIGTIEISPFEKCVMGCGDYKEPTNKCRDELEANFVILSEGSTKVLIITFDLLYIGDQLRKGIINSLSDLFCENEIFIAASHTHYGPMVDDSKKKMGNVNFDYLTRIILELESSVRAAAGNEWKKVEVAKVSFPVTQAVNRRRRRLIGVKNKKFHFNSFVMLPNFKNRNFPDSHLIQLSTDGVPLAILWQYSCHPTSLPHGDGHSAHFIGEVRKNVRAKLDTKIPFLFFQGFSGDLRPPAFNSHSKNIGKILEKVLVGRRFRPFTEVEYRNWCQAISEQFLNYFDKINHEFNYSKKGKNSLIQISRSNWPLGEIFFSNAFSNRVFSIHKLEFEDFILVGVSAELTSDWEQVFKSLNQKKIVIGITCIDDTFGYLPSQRIILEGGYEAGEYCKLFDLPNLHSATPEIFKKKLKSLF